MEEEAITVKEDTLHGTTRPLAETIRTELDIEDNTNDDINKITAKLAAARKELKKIQKNAAAIRDKHLTQLAATLLPKRKDNIEAIIKNMKNCEEIRLEFQQVFLITKGNTRGV
eukprot:5839138-Ditylum_brightwellii.AAC.1